MTKQQKIITSFITGLVLLVANQMASACSCVNLTTQQHINVTETIFSAKVVKKQPIVDSDGYNRVRVTFEVSEWWKEAVDSTTELVTSEDSAGCGYNFTLNEEYLVYESYGSTSLCSGTKLLSNADWDLDLLSGDLLYEGWNLISHSGSSTKSVTDFLNQENFSIDVTPYISIWYWNAATKSWSVHHRDIDIDALQVLDPNLSELKIIHPKKGYWINMEVEAVFKQPLVL